VFSVKAYPIPAAPIPLILFQLKFNEVSSSFFAVKNVYESNIYTCINSEWLLFNQFSNFSAISWREQDDFQWDDDEVRFVLDQHAELDF
jgi:hypothetical protein